MLSALFGVLALAWGLLLASSAQAHDPFEITTDAHVSGAELRLHTTLSLQTAARACLGESPTERRLEPADFEALRSRFESCARDDYSITAGGRPLALRSASVRLTVESDLEMLLAYERPHQSPLVFDALSLRRLIPRAGVVLTVTGARTFLGQKLLRPDDPVLEIPITSEAEALGTPPMPSFGRYLWLGIEHILTGTDHLSFLLGLLVVCRRVRSVAIIVTCFTLAHSLTLALAALELVRLSPRIVEPLIAASIVFVGIENLFVSAEPEGPWVSRWAVAFGFGLIHGLGFAGALQQLGLGAYGTSVIAPLLAFNLGVELGQLSVAGVVLAVLWRLPRTGRLTRLPRLVSLVVAGLGLFWLVQRLAS